MTTQLDSPKSISPELSEALMRSAFLTVGEAILSINSDSIIVMANPEIKGVFGYNPEELLGQHIHTIMPETYRTAHSEGIQRYLKTGIPKVLGIRLELEGLRKDGMVFPLALRIMPTLVGEQRFFTAAMRDVSDEKEQVRLLEEQRTQLMEQNQHLARVHHFFLFTVENMEMTLQKGAEYSELLAYIQQVKTEIERLNRKKPQSK